MRDEDFMAQRPAGMVLEAMTVGLAAEQVRTVTPSDLADFAQVSGDRNPLHMDEDYAEASPFRGRVAHGMLPGPGAIYVSQSLTFKRPVRIGDEVLTRAEVSEVDLKAGHVRLTTRCSVQGKTVLEGEAILRAPRAAPRSR